MIVKKESMPKRKYKNGVWTFNPDNIMEFRDWNDTDELFYLKMEDCKRDTNILSKVSEFSTTMFLCGGSTLSKECIEEFMEYCDLTLEDFLNVFLRTSKNFPNEVIMPSWDWFFDNFKFKGINDKGQREEAIKKYESGRRI